jgi:hypothetical protein
MPQVTCLLEELDQGKSVQELVREEKRRVRKKLDRSTTKLKRLKILEGKKEVGRLSQSSIFSKGPEFDVALTEVCTNYVCLFSGSVFVLIPFCTYIYTSLQRLQAIKK